MSVIELPGDDGVTGKGEERAAGYHLCELSLFDEQKGVCIILAGGGSRRGLFPFFVFMFVGMFSPVVDIKNTACCYDENDRQIRNQKQQYRFSKFGYLRKGLTGAVFQLV